MSKAVTVGATAFLACVLWGTPLSLRLSPEGKVSLSMDGASAQTARMSVPGANRRAHRRAYRRGYYGYGYSGPDRYDYSAYERFSYHGFWGNYGYAYQPWWSK
jgi:hypothetical protein